MCTWEHNFDRKLQKEFIGMSLGQNTLEKQQPANSSYPKVTVQWLNQDLGSVKVCAWLKVKCFEIATFG